jgi:hypothetical protein
VRLHTPLAVACFLVFAILALAQNGTPTQPAGGQQSQNQRPAPNLNLDRLNNADLARLLELIGTRTVSAQMAEQTKAIRKQFTPQTLALTNWRGDTFQSSLDVKIESRITPAALSSRWAPIYTRHFTAEEIKAIVAFYESPAGRRLLEESPALLQESLAAAEQWRRDTVADIRKELDAEFPRAREIEQAQQVTTQKP